MLECRRNFEILVHDANGEVLKVDGFTPGTSAGRLRSPESSLAATKGRRRDAL